MTVGESVSSLIRWSALVIAMAGVGVLVVDEALVPVVLVAAGWAELALLGRCGRQLSRRSSAVVRSWWR